MILKYDHSFFLFKWWFIIFLKQSFWFYKLKTAQLFSKWKFVTSGCKYKGNVLMIYSNVCLHFQSLIFYFDKSKLMFKLFKIIFVSIPLLFHNFPLFHTWCNLLQLISNLGNFNLHVSVFINSLKSKLESLIKLTLYSNSFHNSRDIEDLNNVF